MLRPLERQRSLLRSRSTDSSFNWPNSGHEGQHPDDFAVEDRLLIAGVPSLHNLRLQLHDCTCTADEIKTKIDELEVQAFQIVPFSDIVKRAGSPDSQVESIWAFGMWNQLLDVILNLALRSRTDIDGILSAPSLKSRNLAFIIEPLEHFLSTNPNKLEVRLQMLERRFNQLYRQTIDVDWTTPFSTSSHLFDFILGTTPYHVAQFITASDRVAFEAAGICDYLTKESNTRVLNWAWNSRCFEIREMDIPEDGLLSKLCDIAKRFVDLGNYHSAMAFLFALRSSGSVSHLDLDILALADEQSNYLAYRKQFAKRRGIPWLFPHLKEFTLGKVGDVEVNLGPPPPYSAVPEMRFEVLDTCSSPTLNEESRWEDSEGCFFFEGWRECFL